MRLFIFGMGYTASAFTRLHGAKFETIAASVRSQSAAEAISASGVQPRLFVDGALDDEGREALAHATHLLISIPPDANGDPVLRACADIIDSAHHLRWIGYLSSVAVYGDRNGGWVDEDGELDATSARGRQRISAEKGWLDLGRRLGKPTHIFRLAGIYGPGRNALVNLREGKAKRLIKPGQVFNRIHVDDIAQIVAATIDSAHPGGVWNVADDEPAPPQDVVAYAAELAGVAAPPDIPFDASALSPMAASFYADNKRIANAKVKEAFGLSLLYPTYREGLRALITREGR
ncbi:SDR family oxidoreductase [Terrarubrum flagellatum]|uniref:SDR family oxidoreductase n=1 Tax=Terrirubrum flagellatum TaxID=2895980 RepID=UPI0031455ADE